MKKCLSSAFLKTITILLLFASLLVSVGNVGSMILVDYMEETFGSKEDSLYEAWTRIFFHKAYRLSADYTINNIDLDTLDDSLCYAVLTTSAGEYGKIDFSDCYYLYRSDDFSTEKENMIYALTRIELLDGTSDEEASSSNYWSNSYVYYYYEETLFPMLFQSASFASENSDIYLYREDHTSIFYYYIYDYSSYYYYDADDSLSGNSLTIRDGDDPLVEESTETVSSEAASSETVSSETASIETTYSTYPEDDTDGVYAEKDSSDEAILYYWVVGSVRPNADNSDEFAYASALLDVMWSFADSHAIWLTGSLSIGLLCIIYLCLAAGHRRKKDGITITWVDKMPYGILFVIIAIMVFLLGIISIEGCVCNSLFYSQSYLETVLSILAAVLLFFIIYLLLCLFIASTIVRLKAKSFWRYTLSGFLVRLARHIGRKICINIKDIPSHLPLACTVSLTFVLLTAADFIILALSGMTWFYLNPFFLIVYLILKVVELGVLIFAGLQAERIRKGGQRIAAGDLSEPIPTDGLFGEFKRHAENINKVGDCISEAVDERMKSEHFKTELITNVSHDIRTPLTSIINYVDLMKKENITDPTLLTYTDVLDRQSARLKKLIEDLMEASKASTSNLEMHMETCNLSVFFYQMIGEFEERATERDLTFVENIPEKPIYIMADGRRLWRVLENLFNNACKYSAPGTRIYIDLTVSDINYVVISIKNISKAQLNISSEELLERFVRGDSSRNTEGSGLGLSIAQSLTELMNGSLRLEIDGDLFKVILEFPCTQPPEPLSEQAPELPDESESDTVQNAADELESTSTPENGDITK